jgi:hypothetical protein
MADKFNHHLWFKNQYLNENETSGVMELQEWIQQSYPDIYLSDSISYDDLVEVIENYIKYIK